MINCSIYDLYPNVARDEVLARIIRSAESNKTLLDGLTKKKFALHG